MALGTHDGEVRHYRARGVDPEQWQMICPCGTVAAVRLSAREADDDLLRHRVREDSADDRP